MNKVYIASACRTPIGKFGGSLNNISTIELGRIVIKEVVKRANIPTDIIDHVYMGCVLQAGLGQNVARQCAIKAGLPNKTTAETINVVCGSGLDAVNSGARLIKLGEADAVITLGGENMSSAPYLLNKARYGYRMGNSEIIDSMIKDALWDSFNDYHMGITAENVAEKYGLTRDTLDKFSLNSQNKAEQATLNNKFKDEIVPIEIKAKKDSFILDYDEGVRNGTTLEALAKLKPAFKNDGIVTAGNSSTINDGAAAVLLVSEKIINKFNIKPMAEWLGGCLAGVEPSLMGLGPIVSTNKLLNKLNINMDDIDLVEANEAFASQAIAVQKELGIKEEVLNVNGGAIALGHPVGASGCRILVTLLYEMQRRKANLGLATLCVGGGMGCSTMVKGLC